MNLVLKIKKGLQQKKERRKSKNDFWRWDLHRLRKSSESFLQSTVNEHEKKKVFGFLTYKDTVCNEWVWWKKYRVNTIRGMYCMSNKIFISLKWEEKKIKKIYFYDSIYLSNKSYCCLVLICQLNTVWLFVFIYRCWCGYAFMFNKRDVKKERKKRRKKR